MQKCFRKGGQLSKEELVLKKKLQKLIAFLVDQGKKENEMIKVWK